MQTEIRHKMKMGSGQPADTATIILKLRGQQCNLRCLYCYQHGTRTNHCQDVFPSVTDTVHYLRSFIDRKSVFIVFHGGEPLLTSIDDMRTILDFIYSSFDHTVHVQFQTNGILLDRHWLNLLASYSDISLSVSLDPIGDKDLRFWGHYHDLRAKVMNNLITALSCIRNVGVISIVHKYNLNYFADFIFELVDIGIPGWSVNKVSPMPRISDYDLTEMEYVEVLKAICVRWISSALFDRINIQPLASLFSPSGSRICNFSPLADKCNKFHTFYGPDNFDSICDRMICGSPAQNRWQCLQCDIFKRCGGGCFMEKLSPDFCVARRELFTFIDMIKGGTLENK